jgi:uncharacterized protein
MPVFAGMKTFYKSVKFIIMRKRDKALEKLSDNQPTVFHEGQSVELLIGDRTDLGYKAMIDNLQEGMIYKNEVFQPLRNGQYIKGYIKKLRGDGKIDLCLQKPGHEKVEEVSEKIIDKLRLSGGFLAVSDQSPPEIIYGMFGVSKKTYKKAIGALYRKRLIIIGDKGIRLYADLPESERSRSISRIGKGERRRK